MSFSLSKDAKGIVVVGVDGQLIVGNRQELKQKAEEESRRTVEAARKEIEAERERAVQSVRNEVASLVVAATEKVIGETLDDDKHRKLIEKAIAEVAGGDSRS